MVWFLSRPSSVHLVPAQSARSRHGTVLVWQKARRCLCFPTCKRPRPRPPKNARLSPLGSVEGAAPLGFVVEISRGKTAEVRGAGWGPGISVN